MSDKKSFRVKSVLAAAFTVATGVVVAGGAYALPSPGQYDSYPASFTKTSTCSATDVVTDSVRVGSWQGTALESAPTLKAGDTISWRMHTTNPACASENASLALYATMRPNFDMSVDQTIAVSDTQGFGSQQWPQTITLTVPAGFAGPYQLDAIVGSVPDIVGPHGTYFHSDMRSRQSDTRTTVVTSAVGDVAVTGAGLAASSGDFQDTTTQALGAFDYQGYPSNQFSNPGNRCVPGPMADMGESLGFFINGQSIGNNLQGYQLHAGDVIDYRFQALTSNCYGQKTTLALYRNPEGGDGLVDRRINQRLVTSQTMGANAAGITDLRIVVPSWFRGGYQVDVVLGDPFPVVGNAGGVYSDYNMLKTAAHDVMLAAS